MSVTDVKEVTMMARLAKLAGWAIGFVIWGSLAMAENTYHGYESPAYTVERSVGSAEVRLYAPHMLAEVTVQGDQRQAVGQGFRVLAGYIFGGNTSATSVAMTTPVAQRPSEQIAMTAPVAQSGAGQDWVISFSMPAQYTRDTLPVPSDDRVRFVETAPERQLVLRFSGLGRTAQLEAQTETLRQIAADAGITLGAGPFYYFYDAPLTLPWNRRNEVAFVVDPN
jgi:SOUL heme-binding protein